MCDLCILNDRKLGDVIGNPPLVYKIMNQFLPLTMDLLRMDIQRDSFFDPMIVAAF